MPRLAVASALVALVAWSCWQRWLSLADTPFPVGIDGYYYPLQLRALLEDGRLAYADGPVAFWLMMPFAAATDPIVGAKLAAAVYGALIAVPAYGLGARLGGSRGAGLVAAVLATTSAGSMFLTFEFVKNGIGLTVALAALWLVLRAVETPTRARLGAALAAAVVALLTHKMAGALVVLVGVPAALAQAVGHGALRGRRLLYVVGALLVVGAAGLALVVVARPDDAALLANLWTTEPRWEAPALAAGRAYLAMGHEAAIGGVLGGLALLALSRTVRRALGGLRRPARPPTDAPAPPVPPTMAAGERGAAWALAALAIVIGLPWLAVEDPQGLGFRLRVAAFVPMALTAAVVARMLGAALAARLPARSGPVLREGALVALAIAILIAVPARRLEGRIVAHPAMVAAMVALEGALPAGAVMIIPERHLMFMAAWYTRAPSRLRPEPVPPARRWRLMPLAFIGAGSALDQALLAARREPSLVPPRGTHPRHPNGLVLVPEATWAWVLAQLPGGSRAHYERWPTI